MKIYMLSLFDRATTN